MKLFRLVLALLFINIASFLKAQTTGDLAGFSWKDKAAAIEVLTTAQRSFSADQSFVAAAALPESGTFQTVLYKNVQERLRTGNTDIPTAIIDGYNQSQADVDAGEDEQAQAFAQLVELLKQ